MTASSPPRLGSRDLFPHLQARTYLAHAAISPPSSRVQEAVHRTLRDYTERGVGAFPASLTLFEGLRDKLARLLGARAADIALSPGATHSIRQIAFGIPWRPGDRILLFDGEFPANVTPWQQVARVFDLRLEWLPAPLGSPSTPRAPGALDPSDRILGPLEGALRQGARLVAVSAVQFQTGLRMPLREMAALCHAHGAELAVDTIQASGVVPLNVITEDVDYVACGAHKWLMGLEGAGFTYVRPELVGKLQPRFAGWLSHTDGESFLFAGPGLLRYDRPFKEGAIALEGSSCNVLGYAALDAAVGTLLELGVEAIFEHVQAYLDALEPGLVQRGCSSMRSPHPAFRSGILSVRPPEGVDGAAVVAALRAEGVVISYPDGLLRFAPHFPNALAEVPRVLEAIERAVGR